VADDNDGKPTDAELCDEIANAAIELFAAMLRANAPLNDHATTQRINFTDKQAFELTKTLLYQVLKDQDLA
jgi:hypothetical protein